MGGSCYNDDRRDLLVVGNHCVNNCFPEHGGCASAIKEKVDVRCELRPEMPDKAIPDTLNTVNEFVEITTNKGNSAFLYTPDMFNDFYFNNVLSQLPNRNGNTYIAINGCVRTFADRVGDNWQLLYDKGVREVWLGVESGDPKMRKVYNKPAFSNQEIAAITVKGRENGINICWFLVECEGDTDVTKLQTYSLLKEAQPYRFHISGAERCVPKEQ